MDSVKPGDKLYIPTSCYIGHGEDDVAGGLATVKEIITKDTANPYNVCFIAFTELPSRQYNMRHILENQDKWASEYAGKVAKPDPDYHRYS